MFYVLSTNKTSHIWDEIVCSSSIFTLIEFATFSYFPSFSKFAFIHSNCLLRLLGWTLWCCASRASPQLRGQLDDRHWSATVKGCLYIKSLNGSPWRVEIFLCVQQVSAAQFRQNYHSCRLVEITNGYLFYAIIWCGTTIIFSSISISKE